MYQFFICLVISILLGFGIAVALVEKGKDWPIRKYNILIRKYLHQKVSRKAKRVLECTVCTSFWTTLIADLAVCIIAYLNGIKYFFWPFSGLITLGFTWTIIEFLNAQDKKQDINNYIIQNTSEGEIDEIEVDTDI